MSPVPFYMIAYKDLLKKDKKLISFISLRLAVFPIGGFAGL